jgi:ADP-dependent NAD(P)H-hydrate dehydratase / NAD(P)H-hydrate epimerase
VRPPVALVSVAQMRALEAAAIAAGTTEAELQERAGRAVAEAVARELGGRRGRIAGLVGWGNNGRDAVVAARYLAKEGHTVGVWLGRRHPLSDAEVEELSGAGIDVGRVDLDAGGTTLRRALSESDAAIDGLIGIGVVGPMRPQLARVAEILNEVRAERPELVVVSVDVPSGVKADDGSVPGVTVRADVTVTFGAVKAGLLRFPGARFVGRLVVREIGLPAEGIEALPFRILEDAAAGPLLPSRPIDAHKYRFGRVLAVVGSDAYVGAAYLSAAAAARSGCGLVGVASTETVKRVLATRLPEAVYPTLPMDLDDDPERAADHLLGLLPEQQALLVGPGLGRSAATERFLRRLLEANRRARRSVRAVIDADALALLARWERWWEHVGPGHILTPHAAEMARLAGQDADEVAARPWEAARHHARRWRQVVVLKGPFTSIASPEGATWVYPRANAALATGGTGDVLAGLCAGLVAQGVAPADAGSLTVVVHALAARRIVEGRGWRTLLASDLLDEIPAALRALERRAGEPGP